MKIQQLQTGCLAHFAYFIESDGEAVIIDPLRETKPYLQLLETEGASLKYVLETHFHADFVSGHLDLAQQTDAEIVFGERANPGYDVRLAKDHERLSVGKLSIEVVPTPGHTVESVSYLLFDEGGKPHALFTGDAVFVGDVGRPDLASGNLSQEDLASMLYDSIQRIKQLPDEVLIYPAHGQGSACGKNLGPETFSTIGEQKQSNYAFQEMTREDFIAQVTEGLEQPPAYFFEDAKINIQGYQPFAEVMKKNHRALSLDDFLEYRAEDDVIVLDTRRGEAFEAGHIPGSWNISLRGNYAPWVGALVPFGSRIVLITEPGEEEEAILRLARVGYEEVLGYLEGGVESWAQAGKDLEEVSGIEQSQLPEFLESLHPVILDVRTAAEYGKGHLADAKNIPLAELPGYLDELDPQQAYLVHCAGGYRSMVASSILQSRGFSRLINLRGGYQANHCSL